MWKDLSIGPQASRQCHDLSLWLFCLTIFGFNELINAACTMDLSILQSNKSVGLIEKKENKAHFEHSISMRTITEVMKIENETYLCGRTQII
jgi:hypothetical protein